MYIILEVYKQKFPATREASNASGPKFAWVGFSDVMVIGTKCIDTEIIIECFFTLPLVFLYKNIETQK